MSIFETIIPRINYITVFYHASVLSISIGSGLLSAGAWWLATRRSKIALATLACMLSFMLLDLALFRSMPVLGLSFGLSRIPFLLIAIVRGIATVTSAVGLLAYLALRHWRNPLSLPARSRSLYWAIPVSINLAMTGCLVDGLIIEPLHIDVNHVALMSERWPEDAPPLRIVHISDPHIERLTHRERDALRLVEDLSPDLILMTGDYLNISFLNDAQACEDFREWANQLHARYGVYAVWGNTDLAPWRDELMHGLDITVLSNETKAVTINGRDINLVGIDVHQYFMSKDRRVLERLAEELPQDGFNVLLYHTPDLMPEAIATDKIDLYLAGHTHGGQIRLPFYGAIVTASMYGKRYEAGSYEEERTHLYVSRGLGFEGGHAPRIRFLCPPEITVFDLSVSP